jgi:NADP-dependent 3-hydroxy acid dehydrogenase YdfG
MKNVILVTGISSGFGKEISRLLAEDGHKVYGTVRRETEKTEHVNYLIMDLTDLNSVTNAVSTILKKEGRIDILINNAGMHTGGPVETLPSEYIKLQMDTNFMGMVNLTRAVLPVMRKLGAGRIINVSSIGGLMGLPFQAFYSAAKFAVEGFSEALRMEVNQSNIKVIVINPGDFHTSNSANRRNFLASIDLSDQYHGQFNKTLSIIENDEGKGWEPVVLAKKMVKIVNSANPAQRYVIASLEQKLAVVVKHILPGKLFRIILQDHYKVK